MFGIQIMIRKPNPTKILLFEYSCKVHVSRLRPFLVCNFNLLIDISSPFFITVAFGSALLLETLRQQSQLLLLTMNHLDMERFESRGSTNLVFLFAMFSNTDLQIFFNQLKHP